MATTKTVKTVKEAWEEVGTLQRAGKNVQIFVSGCWKGSLNDKHDMDRAEVLSVSKAANGLYSVNINGSSFRPANDTAYIEIEVI